MKKLRGRFNMHPAILLQNVLLSARPADYRLVSNLSRRLWGRLTHQLWGRNR